MYRNSTVGSLPLGLSRRFLAPCCSTLLACLMFVSGFALLVGTTLNAQTTSGGGIQGTVVDPSGAGVPKAEITATNTDTGVQTKKTSGTTGTYSIQPLQAGNYNVEVVAKGFQRLLQENVTVDNASMFGLQLKLSVGGENTTVTVTDAPPFLNTTDATLGGTIENELYSELPLSMNGGPRDPTAFQYLMPGVQENPNNNTGTGDNNGNSGIYGGTGATNLNENYIEGVPVSNINQQGSSNPVSHAVSVDAVDQFSVQTSTASTSFSGAGVTNYTIKAGGNQFHGSAVDYLRNTMFDTWGYFAKVPSSSGIATKPGEHQNQYDISVGGPIFKDKLFFFADYSGFHYTTLSNTPQYITIPTIPERSGDFTDVLGSSQPYMRNPVLCGYPGASGSAPPTCSFRGLVNGVPTFNVIEPQYMSSISKYLEGELPQPTNQSSFNNYLASLPKENSDYSVDSRLDYTLNSRNKFSLVGVGGNVGYGGQPFYSTQVQLPSPYAAGQFTNQKTASGVFSYVYIASQTLINSLKYGYSRNWGQGFALTAHKKSANMPLGQSATAAGILNLPPGNASDDMPSVTFSHANGPNAPFNWASTSSTGPVATNSYTIIDNLQWIKGRHNITFGAQVQWLQTNGAAYGGFSQALGLTFSDTESEWCVQSSTTTQATCPNNLDGDAYASFLVGAVHGWTIKTQAITDVGARYRPMAPYIQDNWQVSPKLTLNIGFRYDYLQPYHEVKDRISFLNPTTINPIVGIPGVVNFAGFPDIKNFKDTPANGQVPAQTAAQSLAIYAPYICHCTTPVHPYNKNFEPRLGFSYAYSPSTVFSGGFAIQLTHAGGSGGGAHATEGSGNSGEFSATNSGTGTTTSDPEFYLNPGLQAAPNTLVLNQGTQPTAVNGVNGPSIPCPNGLSPLACTLSAVPPWTVPGVSVNPLQSTGNYDYANLADNKNDYGCNTGGGGAPSHCSAGAVNFADPYYGGRGPQFISYNFSMQRMINKKAVLTVAYSGSQTHFLPGGSGRGYAINTFSPDFSQQYKASLTAGGQANPNASPYPGPPNFQSWDGGTTGFAQSLRPFPQFGTMTDLWGSTGNASYNALQISVIQRPWHNLSGLINYTRAKELDNTGQHRTQFPIGPQDGNFVKNYTANQIDRGLGTSNQTNAFNVTWVYSFPIGRGQAFFATNRIAGLIGGGWQFSGIYRYRDGYPLEVTNGAGCNARTNAGQGTCYPDYSPGFDKRRARINGRWGRGPGANAATINQIQYINPSAFQCPDSSPLNLTASCGATNSPTATWKIGNAARSAPDGLHGPGWWEVQLGLRRTFNVRETATLHVTFQLEADVDNATNSTFFNLASATWNTGATSFGTIAGQNKSILPRDWQFAGRLRF
ncbi:MAG TPA: carboxypeptidase-like regulatory domain-containing protein [Acidobacteriaceae bacterium]